MKLKPFIIALAVLLVIVGAVAGVKALQIGRLIASGKEEGGPPTETVSTAQVTRESWDRTVESVGSMRAVQGADLSTEESGVVTKILFENGAEVQEGDLLVELDTDTEQANLRSAEAEQQWPAPFTSAHDACARTAPCRSPTSMRPSRSCGK